MNDPYRPPSSSTGEHAADRNFRLVEHFDPRHIAWFLAASILVIGLILAGFRDVIIHGLASTKAWVRGAVQGLVTVVIVLPVDALLFSRRSRPLLGAHPLVISGQAVMGSVSRQFTRLRLVLLTRDSLIITEVKTGEEKHIPLTDVVKVRADLLFPRARIILHTSTEVLVLCVPRPRLWREAILKQAAKQATPGDVPLSA